MDCVTLRRYSKGLLIWYSPLPSGNACLVYIDNIVMGKIFERHPQNLILVLVRLRRAGLRLKLSKCSLFQEVVHLGHVVTREGIHTDPEKVNVVKTWSLPTSGRNVQQFLRLVGY